MYLDKQLAAEQHPRHQYNASHTNTEGLQLVLQVFPYNIIAALAPQFRLLPLRLEHMNFRGTLIQLGSPRPLSINFSKHETHSRHRFANAAGCGSSGKPLNGAVATRRTGHRVRL